MRGRILSVDRARSEYLRTLSESRKPMAEAERLSSARDVNNAKEALQRAQRTLRTRVTMRAREHLAAERRGDWNDEPT